MYQNNNDDDFSYKLNNMEYGNLGDEELGITGYKGVKKSDYSQKKIKKIPDMVRIPRGYKTNTNTNTIYDEEGIPYPHPNQPGSYFVPESEQPLSPTREKPMLDEELGEGSGYGQYVTIDRGGKRKTRRNNKKKRKTKSKSKKNIRKIKKHNRRQK
jgi:hypothetical protein